MIALLAEAERLTGFTGPVGLTCAATAPSAPAVLSEGPAPSSPLDGSSVLVEALRRDPTAGAGLLDGAVGTGGGNSEEADRNPSGAATAPADKGPGVPSAMIRDCPRLRRRIARSHGPPVGAIQWLASVVSRVCERVVVIEKAHVRSAGFIGYVTGLKMNFGDLRMFSVCKQITTRLLMVGS